MSAKLRLGWSAAVLLFVALLLLPGPARSAFPGAPLSSAGYLLLAGAAWLFGLGVLHPPVRPVPAALLAALALLVVLKPVAGNLAGPLGWRGEYYADADPSARRSFKSGFITRDHRLDRKIDFDGPRLGLHFVNDPLRYRYPFSLEPRDRKFPVAVAWAGYIWLEEPETVHVESSARGRLTVAADGMELFSLDSLATPAQHAGFRHSRDVTLGRGLHLFVVNYHKPEQTVPLVRVRLTARGRELDVVPEPRAVRTMGRGAWLAPLSSIAIALSALLLAGIAVRSYPPRQFLAAPARGTVAVVFGIVLLLGTVKEVLPLRDATVSLSSGDDPLAYEGYARDVLFNGILMPNGASPGHGDPFYHYPFYSYALAAAHVGLGEEFSAVVFFNVLSVASVGVLCWFLAWRHLKGWGAVVGVLAVGAFSAYHLLPYTRTAFSDNLFVSLVFVALLLCERALARGGRLWWVAAGVASAAAAATRPSFLTHAGVWPAAVLLLGSGSLRARFLQSGAFWAGFLLGLLPFAVRNWIMARRAVLLVDSWIQIPYFLYRWDEPKPVPPLRSLGEALQHAWAFVVARPWAVLEIEARKIAFSLGLTEVGPENVGPHPFLLAGFLLFLVALSLRRLPRNFALVLGAFAVSHVAAMVLAAPWTYGYKTILPLHAAFLVGGVYVLRRQPSLSERAEPAGQGGA